MTPGTKVVVARKPRKCYWCGAGIAVGERYKQKRERALSYREAMHAGTMRPIRHQCAKCGEPNPTPEEIR